MAGIFTLSGKWVEERQLGGFGVDGEGADGALLAGFVCGVGPFAVRMNHQPGGIGRFGGEALGSELACRGVEFVGVDALAVGFVRVSADEDEEFLIGRLRNGGRDSQQTVSKETETTISYFHGLAV